MRRDPSCARLPLAEHLEPRLFLDAALDFAFPIGSFDLRAAVTDAAGNVYVAGRKSAATDFDPGTGTSDPTVIALGSCIAKYTSSGALAWVIPLTGGTSARADVSGMAVDGSGNLYVTGAFDGTIDFDPGTGTANLTGAIDVFTAKFTSAGALAWVKAWGSTGADYGNSVAVDGDGNVYTVGTFRSTVDFDPGAGTFNLTAAGTYDAFISKLDASGNFVWAESLGPTVSPLPVAVVPGGGLAVGGYFTGVVDFDPGAGATSLTSAGAEDGFIVKLAADGSLVWARQVGGAGSDSVDHLAVDDAGTVYATGYFAGTVDFDPSVAAYSLTSAGPSNVFVLKLTAAGGFDWADRLGGSQGDFDSGLAVDAAHNIYLAAAYASADADFDPGPGRLILPLTGQYALALVKLDASGALVWARSVSGGSQVSADGIGIDAQGEVFAAGAFSGTQDFDPGAGYFPMTGSASVSAAYVMKLTRPGADTTAPRAAILGPSDGGAIDTTVLNNQGYLDVTFYDPAGVKASTITDAAAEFTLGGTGAASVYLGPPTLVKGATYRYPFAGRFVAGPVTLTFAAGAFADSLGHASPGLGLGFTVAADTVKPSVTLVDPAASGTIDRDVLNGRGYIDVAFDDVSGVYLPSVTDKTVEFEWSGEAAAGVLTGAATYLGYLANGHTYRYSFTGAFAAGTATVTFLAGGVLDVAGNMLATAAKTFTVTADSSKPTVSGPSDGGTIDVDVLNGRRYLEITFIDAAGLNAATILDKAPEFTLSGAAAAGVAVGAPKLLSGTTYRYSFTGNFVPGAYAINFAAGVFADRAGNLNDLIAQGCAVSSAAGGRFGNTAGAKGVKLQKTDADGTIVVFAMTGPGFGEVVESGGAWTLALRETTSASAAAITTTKSATPGDDGQAALAGIILAGPLGSLTAKTTRLDGPMIVPGALKSLALGDVAPGGLINFTGWGSAATAPTIAFGIAQGLVITSAHMPLKSITAASWANDGKVLDAPWVGTLAVTGTKTTAGNFEGDVDLVTQDAKGLSLARLSVAGAMQSHLALAGAAGTLSAMTWANGSLDARSAGTISVRSDVLNVTVALSQPPDAKTKALGTLTVGGTMTLSTVDAAGNVGTVKVGGAMTSGTIDAAGTLGSVTVGGAMTSGTIDAAGNIGAVTVGALVTSTITAGEVPGEAATRAALGSLIVKGVTGLTDCVVGSSISAWNLGTVTLLNVKGDNGTAFGVTSHTLASYTRYVGKTVAKRLTNITGPRAQPVDSDTDFAVTVV